MATFEVTVGDRIFEVDASSPAEARAKADSMVQSKSTEEPLTPRNQSLKKMREDTGVSSRQFTGAIPFQDEITAGLAVPGNMIRRNVSGEDQDEGWIDSVGSAYSEEVQNQREIQNEAREKSPVLSTVSDIAGGLALAGPARGAGGAILPRTPAFEANVAQRMAKSGGIGTGLGAAYGAGEGEGLDDRISKGFDGALWGGGAGVVGQGAGELVTSAITDVIAPMARAYRDPARQARVTATRGFEDDAASGATRLPERGLTDDEFNFAQQHGHDVGNIDKGGEGVIGVADAAYNRSKPAKSRFDEFMAAREQNQLPMMERVIGGMLQSPGDIARRRANLRAGRNAARPLYDEAFAHPNAQAMWDEGYQQFANSDIGQQAMKAANKILLDEAALHGANKVRNPFKDRPVMRRDPQSGQMVPTGETRVEIDPRLQEIGFQPNLQYWDAVKKGLDEVIDGERDGIKGLSRRGQRASELKSRLVDHLDDMTRAPGGGESLYGRARRAAGRYLGEENAAAAGSKLYKSSIGNSDTLESMRLQIARWNPDEREEAAQSFLEALKDDMVGKARSTTRDAGNVDLSLNFLKSEKSRRVAEALLGPERLSQLETHNMIQRVMAYRNKSMKGNSRTWMRAVGDELLSPVAGGLGGAALSGGDPTTMTWGSLAGLLTRRGPMWVNNRLKSRIGPHVADELIGDNPQTYQEVVRNLANDDELRSYLKLMTHPLRLAAGQYGSE